MSSYNRETVLLVPPPDEWRGVLSRGHRGPDVSSWQRVLMRHGYDLSPCDDDGDFGFRTEKRTILFQLDRGLEADGKVGPQTRASIAAPPIVHTQQWPFLQAATWRYLDRANVRLVVIHTMETGEGRKTAESVASWFAGKHGKPPRASAHICIDRDSAVRCVRAQHQAAAAPGSNRDGYHVELAGRAKQTAAQWADDASTETLQIAARHCAKIAERYEIPLVKLTVEEVADGHTSGFCGHADVSKAFRKSTHWDPGPNFPWDVFLGMVQHA